MRRSDLALEADFFALENNPKQPMLDLYRLLGTEDSIPGLAYSDLEGVIGCSKYGVLYFQCDDEVSGFDIGETAIYLGGQSWKLKYIYFIQPRKLSLYLGPQLEPARKGHTPGLAWIHPQANAARLPGRGYVGLVTGSLYTIKSRSNFLGAYFQNLPGAALV